jgi:hypothetical protein
LGSNCGEQIDSVPVLPLTLGGTPGKILKVVFEAILPKTQFKAIATVKVQHK